jgi:hypothetical protein
MNSPPAAPRTIARSARAGFALAGVAAAITAPLGLHAQTMPQQAIAPLDRHASLVPNSETTSSAAPVWIYIPGSEWDDGPGRTAIDHAFAPASLVGSVGYLCHGDSPPLGSRTEDMDISSRPSRQDSFLGATLSYAFK